MEMTPLGNALHGGGRKQGLEGELDAFLRSRGVNPDAFDHHPPPAPTVSGNRSMGTGSIR